MSKSLQVNIRCEDSQKEQWEKAAANDRRTLTDWIRIQLDDAAARQLKPSGKGKSGPNDEGLPTREFL